MQRVLCINKNNFTLSKLNKKIKNRIEVPDCRVRFEKSSNYLERLSIFDYEYSDRYYIDIEEVDNIFIITTENEKDGNPRADGIYDEVFAIIERIILGGTR